MPQLKVPTMLRATVGGEREIAALGGTLRDVINNVNDKHPGFADQLLDPGTHDLRPFVNVYVNDEDARYLQRLDTQLDEMDVVSILPAVAGGR